MAAALSEEQFLCSICLEVFSAPVTAPCGHSFCSVCINQHWDTSDHCTCPICKRDFSTRPQMNVNTVLAELISHLKIKPEVEDFVAESSEPQSAPTRDVVCDLCPEPGLKALKSCLVCLASYCQSHLQPHLTNPRLKRHHLIEARPNLEERICSEHDRPLELFCKDHSHFMCLQCSYAEHQGHNTIPLKEECEGQQATLKEQIKDRLLKVEEIQRSVELSRKNADTEIQESVRFFTTLMESVQQSMDMFKQSIEEKHQKSEAEAAELIAQIQTEISELEQRGAEMEQLWSSGDHLQFLQTFTSAKPAPQLKDWKEKTVIAPTYEGRVTVSVSELQKTLTSQIQKLFKAELKKVKNFAVDITLDPDTAHRKLALSKDLKQVSHCNQEKNLPQNPERFSRLLCVFGKQKFSSGRFYFEVQVKGKDAWQLGVAKESVDRKDDSSHIPQNGYWVIQFNNGNYQTEEEVIICPASSSPEKVGVFVDYDEGVVAFYDVDKECLIYSFTECCFTENLLPLFNPFSSVSGLNAAPLVVTPVDL